MRFFSSFYESIGIVLRQKGKFHLLLAGFICSCMAMAHAQQTPLSYAGEYMLYDSLPGTAFYEFRIQNGDTLKHGKFTFQYFIESYQETDSTYGTVLSGNFLNNIKNGPWEYASKQLAIASDAQALGSKIVYDATGTEFLIFANFQEGKVHGDYELVHRQIVKSEPADTSFYTKMQYQDGNITGKLIGFTPTMHVEGQFDEDGFPDGDWIFTHQLDSSKYMQEIRRYDHGFFSKHFYDLDDRLLEIKHIGFDTLARSGRGMLTRFPATPSYFRALDYTNIVMDTTAISGIVDVDSSQQYIANANAFLERVFISPASYRDQYVWQSLEGSDSISSIRVKVSKFAFSEEEVELNKDNEIVLTETQSLINDFLENPNTEVGRYTNKNLNLYYHVLQIYRDRLSRIAPVIKFLADEASEYVDHDAILAHNAVEITYPESVIYEFEDQKQTNRYSFPANLTTFKATTLNEHLTAVFEDVSAIITKTEGTLVDYQAQSDLRLKERRLISLRDSVINLFQNTEERNDFTKLHQDMQDSVSSFLETSFKQYAGLVAYRRLLVVDSLQACYQSYAELYPTLGEYQDKLDKLDLDYTRSIWNAYTYTYMEERMKERLYTVFEETVFPYVWNHLRTDLSCDRLPTDLANIERLLERMAELRMEDTKELEKNLRRSRADINTYLEILGLSLHI